jgi:hypothetical protein
LILPKLDPQTFEYGTVLEEVFLTAVERAYKTQFPGRVFNNHRKGTLAGQVTIEPSMRHDLLVEQMKQGPKVVLYFPDSLRGFSIEADRQQIKRLPPQFTLAGVLDTATAMALHPATLGRDWNTPGLDCAAVSWESSSLYFRASDDYLVFGSRFLDACDYYSGGLVFLG